MEGQTSISCIEDRIKIDKLNLVKIHLFIKMTQNKISDHFTDRELAILSYLYMYGGIVDKSSMQDFSEKCFSQQLCEKFSVQSVRNVLGKAREFDVVKRRKSNNWKITESYLPKLAHDTLVFKYTITNMTD